MLWIKQYTVNDPPRCVHNRSVWKRLRQVAQNVRLVVKEPKRLLAGIGCVVDAKRGQYMCEFVSVCRVDVQALERHCWESHAQQLPTFIGFTAPRAHVQVVTLACQLPQHVHVHERHVVLRDAQGVKWAMVVLNSVLFPERSVEVEEQAPRQTIGLQVTKPHWKHFFWRSIPIHEKKIGKMKLGSTVMRSGVHQNISSRSQ